MNHQGDKKSSALLSFAAFIVVIYGLQMAKELLIPFIIASFLTLLAYRPMIWLQKKLDIFFSKKSSNFFSSTDHCIFDDTLIGDHWRNTRKLYW